MEEDELTWGQRMELFMEYRRNYMLERHVSMFSPELRVAHLNRIMQPSISWEHNSQQASTPQITGVYQNPNFAGFQVYGKNENLTGLGLIGYEHLLGPTLVLLGQPIKALKPVGMLGSKRGSSIASYYLSKAFPQKFNQIFPQKLAIHIVKKTGTNAIGRFAGRMVPYVGWCITVYDVVTWSYKMGQKYGPLTGIANKI